jgi:hypothetical protein
MQVPDPWPSTPFATWRLWDAYVDWPHLEREPGQWNFSSLDRYVLLAEQHNVEVLLPLGLSPPWASSRPNEKSAYSPGNAAAPKDLNDWKTYVRTVATRYKGRIHYYEIWNEPNVERFFSGSPQEMVVLTREAAQILKQIDPSNHVVSPSATGEYGSHWLDKFLAAGGDKFVDVIGYHFYVAPKPPEAMVSIIDKVRQVMTKYGLSDVSIWDTETGWAIANQRTEVKPQATGSYSRVLMEDEASAFVARSYLLAWRYGLSRLYWYSWDNSTMGLTEADGATPKRPAKAYSEVADWLVGARMVSCQPGKKGIWTCQMDRDGNSFWIVWDPDQTVRFALPREWNVQDMRDLAGNRRSVTGTKSVQIGPNPIMFEKAGL